MNPNQKYTPPYENGLHLVHLKDDSQIQPFLSFAGYPKLKTSSSYEEIIAANKESPLTTPIAIFHTERRPRSEFSTAFGTLKDISVNNKLPIFFITSLPKGLFSHNRPLFFSVSSIATIHKPVVCVEKHQEAPIGSFPLL